MTSLVSGNQWWQVIKKKADYQKKQNVRL